MQGEARRSMKRPWRYLLGMAAAFLPAVLPSQAGEKARNDYRDLSRHMTLEACFQCHVDARDVAVNPSGDIRVHYGATNQPAGVSGGRMVCVDCHYTLVQLDVFENHVSQTRQEPDDLPEIRCQDCHGTIAAAPWEINGNTLTAQTGSPLEPVNRELIEVNESFPENVVRAGDGAILKSVTGRNLDITLLHNRYRQNKWSTHLAKQTKTTAPHNQNMNCMDCHSDWAPACLGCHESSE